MNLQIKMKILLLISAIILAYLKSFSQISFPQLQAGVYVCDSLDEVGGCFTGNCSPFYDLRITMDTNLIPVVQGVEIKLVVTQLSTPPDSVYTLENGIVHLYDTLAFSSVVNNHYTFFSTAAGCYTLKLIINGTPTTPFENYFCQLQSICTLPTCFAECNYAGFPPICTVDDFNGINESENFNYNISIKPNPAFNGNLIITYQLPLNKNVSLQIIDSAGKLTYSLPLIKNSKTVNLQLSNLPSGIYKCILMGENVLTSKTFTIITN